MIDVLLPDVRGGRLHELIDTAAAGRPSNSSLVTIALQPGWYTLEQPITLHQEHANLTLRDSPQATTPSAAPGSEQTFGQGLIVLDGALLRVRASQQQDKTFATAINVIAANRHVLIGNRPVHCTALTISDYAFQFTLGTQVSTPGAATAPPPADFDAGVFAADCSGLHLERNRSLHNPPPLSAAGAPQHALAGYMLTPAMVAQTSVNKAFRQFNDGQIRALLDDAVIRDDTFDGLSAAVMVLSDLGTIRISDNTIRRCCAGIWLTDATAAALTDLSGIFSVPGELKDQVAVVHAALITRQLDLVLLLLTVFGRTFLLPALGQLTPRATPAVSVADLPKLRAAGQQARHEWMAQFVNDVNLVLTPVTLVCKARARATIADTPTAAPPTDFNQGVGGKPALAQGNAFQQQLRVANAGLAPLARFGDTVAQSELTLRFECNDIEIGLDQPATSGPPTFVEASPRDVLFTSAEVTANRVSSTGAAPAVARLVVTSQTITGNIITAANAKATSLTVASSPPCDLGNVTTGPPVLPANRPFPAPLDN